MGLSLCSPKIPQKSGQDAINLIASRSISAHRFNAQSIPEDSQTAMFARSTRHSLLQFAYLNHRFTASASACASAYLPGWDAVLFLVRDELGKARHFSRIARSCIFFFMVPVGRQFRLPQGDEQQARASLSLPGLPRSASSARRRGRPCQRVPPPACANAFLCYSLTRKLLCQQ